MLVLMANHSNRLAVNNLGCRPFSEWQERFQNNIHRAFWYCDTGYAMRAKY